MAGEAQLQPDTLTAGFGGRYTVSALLGRGGMATVWLAQDTRHGRPVAIKLLRAELVRPFGAARFMREIGIAARLNHPHILAVLDSGFVTLDGVETPYFTMPWVQGRSLAAILQDSRRLPIRDAVRYAAEAADALEYAHAAGVVHRDIKPGNILIQAGHALVADFGIAAVHHTHGPDQDSITSTGEVLGTPLYMSPEQASGEEVDGRTDVYSLGCVLYEMLAGVPPLVADNRRALVVAHLTARPPSLASKRPDVDPGLAAAVTRALAKNPADRFASAAAFRDALGRLGPAPSQERTRWPWLAVAAAMGLAAVWYAARPRATAGLPLEPMVVQLGGFRDASSTLRAEAAALNDGLRGELQAVPGLRLVDAVGLPEVPLDSLRQTDVAWVVRGAVDRLGDSVGATVRLLEVGTGAEVRSTTQRAATPADLLRQATALGPRSAFGVVRFTLDSVLRDRNELALGGDRQQLALRNRARQAASRAEEAMLTVGPRRMLEEFALADSLLHSGTPRDASVLLDYERARLGVHRGIALFGARQFFPDSSWLEDPKSVFLGTLPLAASVIRRAPQFADALLIRGGLYDWLYEVSGDPAWGDSALADLQQASALAGSRADIWEQRAMLEMQGGRTREALYSIEQGLAADHLLTHAEGLIYRQAVVQGRLGQFDAARESCRRGVAGFPGSPYFVVCEAEVLVRVSRDARDATRLLLLADSLDSHGTGSLPPFTPSELRLYAAAILARAANGDSARSLYAAVARGWKVESSGDLLLDAIYVQQELGDLDSAVTLAAHVAREWPSSTAWLNMLPWFAPVRQHPGYPAAVARATGNRP